MNYRKLGRTGLEVSEIGFGAWGIGGSMWLGADDDESLVALNRAIDFGLDPHRHRARLRQRAQRGARRPGGARARRAGRVATKIPPKNGRWPAPDGIDPDEAFPADHVRECTERSLRNLGLDTIDVQQFHVWSDEWAGRGSWHEAIEELEVGGQDPRLRRLDQRPSARQRAQADRERSGRHRAGDLQRLRPVAEDELLRRLRRARDRRAGARAVRRGRADRPDRARHRVPGRRLPQPLLPRRPQAAGGGARPGDPRRPRHRARAGCPRSRCATSCPTPPYPRPSRACGPSATSSATARSATAAGSPTIRSPRSAAPLGSQLLPVTHGRRRGGSGRRRSRASRPFRSGWSSGCGSLRRRLRGRRALAILRSPDEVEDVRDADHGDDPHQREHGSRQRRRHTARIRPVSEHVLRERLASLDLEQKVRLLTGADFWALHDEPAAGLRRLVTSDGPAGVRGEQWDEREPSATVPSPTLLAATWDEARIERLGRLLAAEARRKGVDVVLAPMVNLHRTPFGGRHFESFSEDPLLTGRIGAAYVRGLQAEGVGATVKHFVANDSETDRFTLDTRVDERALRELYLAPFETIVRDAGPWTVMAAYNGVNGSTMTESPMLQDMLHDEWGLDGLVCPTGWRRARRGRRQRRARPRDAGTRGAMGRRARRRHPRRPGERGGDRRQGPAAAAARRARRRARGRRARRAAGPAVERRGDRRRLRSTAAAGFVLTQNDGLLPLEGGTVAVAGPERGRGPHAGRRQRDRLPGLHRLAARRAATPRSRSRMRRACGPHRIPAATPELCRTASTCGASTPRARAPRAPPCVGASRSSARSRRAPRRSS